jgi:hypothetical protein
VLLNSKTVAMLFSFVVLSCAGDQPTEAERAFANLGSKAVRNEVEVLAGDYACGIDCLGWVFFRSDRIPPASEHEFTPQCCSVVAERWQSLPVPPWESFLGEPIEGRALSCSEAVVPVSESAAWRLVSVCDKGRELCLVAGATFPARIDSLE